jgi:hypothetical protein
MPVLAIRVKPTNLQDRRQISQTWQHVGFDPTRRQLSFSDKYLCVRKPFLIFTPGHRINIGFLDPRGRR